MLIADKRVERKAARINDPSNAGLDPARGLIIEFVGPPGCGKTTNCAHFSTLLNDKGVKTYVFKDVKEFLYSLGFLRRIRLYVSAPLYNIVRLFSYFYLLASNGILSADSGIRYIKLCIFDAAAREFMKTRRVDVLLLDQWIIQSLWSATIFKARTYVTLQQRLPEFYFPASCVLYFDLDPETASDRIEARASDTSRFDRMDPERRLAEMKHYNDYLKDLYKRSECASKLTFSAKVDPHINAEAFLKHLQSTFPKEN